MDDLIDRGIANATDVVVGGGSAGALGVYLNLDYYRKRIETAAVREGANTDGGGIRFSGLPDGGFFMDLNNKGYHDGMAWIASSGGMNAALDETCVANHQEEPALCMFAPHLAPFIQTPIFALQAKYDAWQIPNILGSKDVATVNAFGKNTTLLLEAWMEGKPSNGMFVDACYHHCGGWDVYTVDGWTEATAFAAWYAKGGAALPNGGRLVDGSAYPCKTCTCQKQ